MIHEICLTASWVIFGGSWDTAWKKNWLRPSKALAEALKGLAEALKGLAEAFKDLAKALKGLAEALKGLAETLEGPG